MKHFSRTFFLAIAGLMTFATVAWAATQAAQDDTPSIEAATKASATMGTPLNAAINAPSTALKKSPAAQRKAISSIDDLAGKYVMTFESLSSSLGDGGNTATITKLSNDSVQIQGFYADNVTVHAAVNISAKTITIPCQVSMTSTTYGACDLAVMTSAGAPDRTSSITGTIADDGSITINGYWGIFINSGTYADYYLYAGGNTLFEVPNGTMHVNRSDTTLVHDWAVILEQTGSNLVTVKNFANHGKTVEIVLNSDGTISIAKQLTWNGGTNQGDYYTYAANWTSGNITSENITGTVTSDKITWGNWTTYSTNKYYTGKLTDATITGITFSIPTLSTTALDGSGTEADPFRIRTLDDMVYLAQTVNNDTNLIYGGPTNYYGKSYEGKYLKIENDIDMSNYRFTPIGNDWYHRFAGTIDGGNHTLTGLNVNTSTSGCAALFGFVDTTAVIKNITLKNATVQSAGYYTGGIAGYCYGTIQNCHVSGYINSTGIGTGGVVAGGYTVTDCSFDGTVNGLGGITGGVAGQIYGTITGSHATGTVNVGAATNGYSGGGVVGNLYGSGSTCSNCYFYGVVDGTHDAHLYIGGVAGQNVQGIIDGCFSVANVYGLDTKAATGGVVGMLAGTVTNSYATGLVQNAAATTTGGIVGSVRYALKSTTDTVQSTIKNSYFAGYLVADTYMYDSENEFRETLGDIYTGANPTVENIYFDNQMTNLNSTHYGITTAEMTAAAGPSGFPSDKWTFTAGYYPRLTALADNDAAKVGASVATFNTLFPDNTSYVSENVTLTLMGNTTAYLLNGGKLSTTGHCGSISSGTYTLNQQFGNDTLVFYNSAVSDVAPRYLPLMVAPKLFSGNGLESDPFQIKTKADVMLLGEITSTIGQQYNNVYFKQLNDIDMESDTTFLGLACTIGDVTTRKFGGIYDGAGHTLHNLWLYYVGWETAPTETTQGKPLTMSGKSSLRKGFIGTLAAKGVIKNLTLASDCQFDMWGYSGPFVGYNYGTIDNCVNYSTARYYSGNGGGIVGQNNKTGVVRNCLNAGHVLGGWKNYGGIAGNSSGLIENCMNVGTVEVQQLSLFQTSSSKFKGVGGIVGHATGGIFRNLVNAGHVEAAGGDVGGLFGSFESTATAGDLYLGGNDTYCCVDYGTAFSGDISSTSAIGGDGYSKKAIIQNVYYDKQVTGLKAVGNTDIDAIKACNSSELLSGTALTGFDTDVWTFTQSQYPVLTQFASNEMVKAAAATQLTIVAEQTVSTLTSDVTLSTATWSLTDGTQFTLSGNTLKVPTVTDASIYDTLVVVNGDFNTKYALVSVMPAPVAGSGTLEDPFQIVDPRTWDAFAHYMATTANGMDGKYVKIMNDINFADTTFVPFAYDGKTNFNGHLLGNNATVSGINYTTTGTYQGAIFYLSEGATVQDLTLQGTITTAKSYTGGFFGKMYGTATNCVNNIAIEATAATVGGFAGQAYDGATFINCTNNAAITSTKGNVAGFCGGARAVTTFISCVNNGDITNSGTAKNTAGFVANGYAAVYKNCVNNGTIKGEKSADVAGLQAYAAGADTIFFTGCYNTGTITGASSVAGLLGATLTTQKCAPIYADSCYNTGDITSSLKSTNGTAGLFAMLPLSSNLSNCYNTGKITAATAPYCGGVWGYQINATSETATVKVDNCYNTGDITSEANYVSGVGSIPAYSTITNCYNTGTITGATAAGGVGNIMGKYATVSDCWNSGNVTATKDGAGGISGYANTYATVTNCFNTGDITATTKGAGGLGGLARSIYTNCYNRGKVTAPQCVGGLVGTAYAATSATYSPTSFYHCYNAGMVVEGDSLSGNIVGNTGNWDTTQGNIVEDTYYVTDYYGKTYVSDSIGGTATTVKELAASEDLPGNWSYGDEYTYPIIKGMEDNLCAKTFAVAVVLIEPDTYENVTGRFYMGEQDNVTWTSSTDSIYINDYAFIGGPVDKMYTPVTMTAVSEDGLFQAPWFLQMNAETGLTDTQLTDRVLIGSRYYNITGAEVSEPQKGNIYIRIDQYNDGTQSAVKIRR